MAITAIISSITKIGEEQIEVQAQISDGTVKSFILPLETDRPTIRQTVKAEVVRLNSIEGKVAALQVLVGTEIV